MKTFLKILLIAALLVLAIKLGPVIFCAAFGGLIVAGLLGVLGISLLALLATVLLALAVALSPIWIPVLAIVGIVSLLKRDDRSPPVATA